MTTCALVIGHKRKSPGASNANSKLSEFVYNESLAIAIENEIDRQQLDIEIQRVYRRTYQTLPDDINELAPDFIVSMHCNAFNTKASGSETLYYHKSKKGKKMAAIIQKHFVNALNLPDRGIKPKGVEDRGGFILRHTNAPCVITEPFFIDNDEDLSVAQLNSDKLINAYVDSIKEVATLFS